MRQIIRALAFLALLLPSVAFAQCNSSTPLPANTVLGRLGIGPGPCQAIPLSTFFNQMASPHTWLNSVAPSTPSPGTTATWTDSTTKVWSSKDDTGLASNTVVPSTAPTNQFANSMNAAGVIGYAQPTVGNLAGFGTNVQAAVGAALNGSGGLIGFNALGSNVFTFLGNATSANLAAALTDETGTGPAVFSISPALTGTPTAPTAAAGTNTTQLATTAAIVAERGATKTLTNTTYDSAATGNSLSVSGVAVSRGQYPGESSTGSATAGNVGEYFSVSLALGSAVTLTTAVIANVVQQNVAAGDYDVRCGLLFVGGATTNSTFLNAGLSSAGGTTIPTSDGLSSTQWSNSAGQVLGSTSFNIAPVFNRFSLSSSGTIFCNAQATFTVSTMKVYGAMQIRRAR